MVEAELSYHDPTAAPAIVAVYKTAPRGFAVFLGAAAVATAESLTRGNQIAEDLADQIAMREGTAVMLLRAVRKPRRRASA